ncbi:MAG: CDP-glucose 4,6-dehydratase [Solirubrobacterales bacterium]
MVGGSIWPFFKGKRVLVTGHTGFKGSWLAFWLHELGAKVAGYALAPERENDHFHLLGLADKIHHVESDIRDEQALIKLFADFQPEIVIHLAAQALVRQSYQEPKHTFDTNIGGSVNLLEAVRATSSVRSLVYITSDKAYKNKEWIWGYRENDELGGRDPYSASKAAAELVFQSYLDSFLGAREGFGAASARAGNVIGGGDWSPDRIVPDTIQSLVNGRPVELRNPSATRPWQHVLEPLSGYLTLAARLYEQPKQFQGSWNFGPEGSGMHTVKDLAEQIITNWGSGTLEVRPDPNAPHEAGLLHLNCDKARYELNWRPRWGFERTVAETAAWYRDVSLGKQAETITRVQINAYMDSENHLGRRN